MKDVAIDPVSMIRPGRKVVGYSAVLLPFAADRSVDWDGFDRLLTETVTAGLYPAVNMDTGYMHLIDRETRQEVLRRTAAAVGHSEFAAGAYVADRSRDPFQPQAHREAIAEVLEFGGTPIVVQSHGLTAHAPDAIADAYREITAECSRFIAFELGTMFAPFGAIYDLDTYASLMAIDSCIGAKHSSLDRALEWQRLVLRDRERPEFMVFTGNDLAIDMVMYGSDYLLGLSAFAPDLFAQRDRMWASGDAAFYTLNDRLQYLGFFAFRSPVPAYRHSAAQFLHRRGWIETSEPHVDAARRPATDEAVMAEIANMLGIEFDSSA